MTKEITFLSFSGGLDSTTLLCQCLAENAEVRPVFFNYGSKHNPFELACAKKVLATVAPDTALMEVDLRPCGIFSADASALLASSPRAIPEKEYKQQGSLDVTVVPGRNLIMASVLASMAEVVARRFDGEARVDVELAVHAGDHALYPDCRPGFVMALQQVIGASTGGTVQLRAPFLHLAKHEIVRLANDLGAPLHLTRSCYKQQDLACGKCGTCRERLEAFRRNGWTDPAPYAPEE